MNFVNQGILNQPNIKKSDYVHFKEPLIAQLPLELRNCLILSIVKADLNFNHGILDQI